MAKKVYVGVSNPDGEGSSVARKVKKMYLGVEGTARKVKKGYIGVGGVARPFWSGGELAYYGELTNFGPRANAGAASIGNYAIFAGGFNDSTSYLNTSEGFNKSLTHINISSNLRYGSYESAGASNASYAIFAGGYKNNRTTNRSEFVHTYDSSLTYTLATSLSAGRFGLSGTTIGDYAIFGAGYGTGSYRSSVDAYNSSLTRSNPTSMNGAVYEYGATSNGLYAIFAGGSSGTYHESTQVTAYNASLTKFNPTYLPIRRDNIGATSVGEYALFGGGLYAVREDGSKVNYPQNIVDTYNASLTRGSAPVLSSASSMNLGVSIGEHAMIFNSDSSNIYADVYNASLTKTNIAPPNKTSTFRASTTNVGDYALIAGYQSYRTSVDVYSI